MAWCLTNIINDLHDETDMINSKPGQTTVETDPDVFEELLKTMKETNGNSL